jgi:murein DD-endopeptidase MepM/ murein hydrolase activator NlpD
VKASLLIAAPVAGILALVLGVVVILSPGDTASGLSTCTPQPASESSEVSIDFEQRRVAETIISVGKELAVPARGMVVALAAGLQESGLRPLAYGDRDSLGIFQQRTAWGSVQERMNPRTSAVMFFTGGHGGQPGLLDITGWEDLSVTEAAQAVQRSAYPDAYAKWESLAISLVRSIAGYDASCIGAGTWVFPLDDAAYVLTASFGDCGGHWDDCHTGQDFAAPTGTPVVAAGQGVVVFAESNGAYGNAVRILHAEGIATWYAHLSRIEIPQGTSVRPGQVIGLVGSTGNSTGPHLHFEVRLHATRTALGTPIDPPRWLHGHGVQIEGD